MNRQNQCTTAKQISELEFWATELVHIQRWYRGDFDRHYGTPAPRVNQKISSQSEKQSAVMAWHRYHQEPKYLHDLSLDPVTFHGCRLLDIGSGPIPSATCFRGANVFALDPLIPDYLHAGYPLHCYPGVTFVNAPAERVPFPNNFFDAVISVNAIDHVDDIDQTACEIKRVLKPGGVLRMHVHYHPPTTCEPVQLDNNSMLRVFGNFSPKLHCVSQSKSKYGHTLSGHENYALWSSA